MSDVDAGVLWGCLQHLDEIQTKRLQIWDFYHDNLWSSSKLWSKPCRKTSRANAHIYYLQFYNTHTRLHFERFIKQQCGIVVASHYKPLDTSPFVIQRHRDEQCKHATGGISDTAAESATARRTSEPCKNAEMWSNSIVRLPIFFDMTMEQQVRIVNAVNSFAELYKDQWTVRPATPQYWEAIRHIRNHHRFYFGQTEVIDAKTHREFMEKHWRTYRVAVCHVGRNHKDDKGGEGEQPCVMGFIGQVQKDLRIATHPQYLKQGVADFMIRSFRREYPERSWKVRRMNHPTLAMARKLGLVPDPKDWEAGSDPVRLIRIDTTSQQPHGPPPLASKL
jgi:hypothetical protein